MSPLYSRHLRLACQKRSLTPICPLNYAGPQITVGHLTLDGPCKSGPARSAIEVLRCHFHYWFFQGRHARALRRRPSFVATCSRRNLSRFLTNDRRLDLTRANRELGYHPACAKLSGVNCPMSGRGRDACVSLEVENADGYYAEWSGRGVAIERPPENEEWMRGLSRSPIPFGNTIFVIGRAVR